MLLGVKMRSSSSVRKWILPSEWFGTIEDSWQMAAKHLITLQKQARSLDLSFQL